VILSQAAHPGSFGLAVQGHLARINPTLCQYSSAAPARC
jgi:hypothetical protein